MSHLAQLSTETDTKCKSSLHCRWSIILRIFPKAQASAKNTFAENMCSVLNWICLNGAICSQQFQKHSSSFLPLKGQGNGHAHEAQRRSRHGHIRWHSPTERALSEVWGHQQLRHVENIYETLQNSRHGFLQHNSVLNCRLQKCTCVRVSCSFEMGTCFQCSRQRQLGRREQLLGSLCDFCHITC